MVFPTLWRSGNTVWNDGFTARHELDRVLDRFFSGAAAAAPAVWAPVVDVQENDAEIRVLAELPGLTAEDVEVNVENGVLTISGEKKQERERGEGTSYHVLERRYGRFERSFALPRSVEADQVKAAFDSGVLTVTLPKAAAARPRRVQVESGKK